MCWTSSTVITSTTLVVPSDKLGDTDAVDEQIDAEAKLAVAVVGKHRLLIGQVGARGVPLKADCSSTVKPGT